jgi:two-component system OmpR family response regulator
MALADKVLIIDDEPDSCMLWKTFLTRLKYTVFTALTLRQGLELVDSVRPDIIFLDNNLPDGLGWEQVDSIQQKIPDCQINLVSAYDFDPAKYQRPNVNVLRKPITLSRIKSLLK